jgi:hypothetical protein
MGGNTHGCARICGGTMQVIPMSTWLGDDLNRTLASQQAARTRRRVYAVIAAFGVGWAIAAASGQRGLGVVIAAIAATGVLAETAVAFHRRRGADRIADALIEQRFAAEGRSDAVSATVQRRVQALTSQRRRSELAGQLRWHVRLERRGRQWPVTSTRSYLDHEQLVEEVADLLECAPPEPRASILATRLLTTPPGSPIDTAASDGRIEFGTALTQIRELLGTGGRDGYSRP